MQPGTWLDSLTGFVNSLTGLGTTRDKGAVGQWYFAPLGDDQLENAYRSSWMARKAVDIPAFDSIRAGWAWQAEQEVITAIEAAEKRLDIRGKVFDALSAARLYGGAGIIIGDGAVDPMQPLRVETIRAGQVKFLTVLSRRYLIAGELDRDPMSPTFLEPREYTIHGGGGQQLRLHPSRVIRFDGARVPDALISGRQDRWSDSVLDSLEEAVRAATSGQMGIAHLIQEAKVDVIGVPGLTDKISSADYEARLIKRFGLASQGKSMVNALIKDAEETWAQKTISFQGLPDVQRILLQIVSGAADIPATRFLGQAPIGMNSTGESDMRNYYDRVSSQQELDLRPRLERLEEIVIRSELGRWQDDWTLSFNSLWQLTEKEQAEVGKMEAETDNLHVLNGTMPGPVLEAGIRNRLIERGTYPGLEQAFDNFDAGILESRVEELEPPEDDGEPEPEAEPGTEEPVET